MHWTMFLLPRTYHPRPLMNTRESSEEKLQKPRQCPAHEGPAASAISESPPPCSCSSGPFLASSPEPVPLSSPNCGHDRVFLFVCFLKRKLKKNLSKHHKNNQYFFPKTLLIYCYLIERQADWERRQRKHTPIH